LKKSTYGNEDFEDLSFHDNFIHAMTFDPDEFELLFDIDYLTKWVLNEGQGHYSFVIAPSTLIFRNVYDVEVDISVGSVCTFDISEISRELLPRRTGAAVDYYRFEIKLDHVGTIKFTSTSFNLYLRSIHEETDSQMLSRKERGGISFDEISYA